MSRLLFVVPILLALCIHARAVDFTEILLDDDGCPMKNDWSTQRSSATIAKPECAKDPAKDVPLPRLDLTLGDLVYYSLSVAIPTEQPPPTGDEKFKRDELGKQVRRSKDEQLTSEEVTMIKKVVGLLWGPHVIGIVYRRVDPALAKKTAPK
jgi:hypothetical protein